MLKRQVRDLPQLACGDLSDGLVFDAVRIRLGAGVAFPGSVREDRPGFPVVSVTRLQSSLNATARVLLSSVHAFDIPLSASDLSDKPGPANERSGTHPDGTHTPGSEAACRTQHGGRLVSGDGRLGCAVGCWVGHDLSSSRPAQTVFVFAGPYLSITRLVRPAHVSCLLKIHVACDLGRALTVLPIRGCGRGRLRSRTFVGSDVLLVGYPDRALERAQVVLPKLVHRGAIEFDGCPGHTRNARSVHGRPGRPMVPALNEQ